jgi:hypothetical protein
VYLDRSTGRRVSVTSGTRRIANLQLLAWRQRQRRGGRPDSSFEQLQAFTVVPLAQARRRRA